MTTIAVNSIAYAKRGTFGYLRRNDLGPSIGFFMYVVNTESIASRQENAVTSASAAVKIVKLSDHTLSRVKSTMGVVEAFFCYTPHTNKNKLTGTIWVL